MENTMERAIRENYPQKILDSMDEETWRLIRLHDTEYAQHKTLGASDSVMKAVKILAYPFMREHPLFSLLASKEGKNFDLILQGAFWMGYLVCQDEMRGRAG